MPSYLLKRRNKELEYKDNYYDQVMEGMKNEGKTDISNFLVQLKERAEEKQRQTEEAERAKADEDSTPKGKKRDQNKATKNPETQLVKTGQKLGKDGKPIPLWKPILELPSEKYCKLFVDRGKTFKTLQRAFRTNTRE